MPICHQKKFIFLHIPRCGGTAITEAYGINNIKALHGLTKIKEQYITLQHLTLSDLIASNLVDKTILESYFIFTIIRDPFKRMVSDYFWQRRHDRSGEFGNLNFMQYLDLAEHVLQNGLYFEKPHYDHFRPMTSYCVENDALVVDEILLLENLSHEMTRLQPQLGSIKLTQINSSTDSHNLLNTQENIARVEELYQADRYLYESVVNINLNKQPTLLVAE